MDFLASPRRYRETNIMQIVKLKSLTDALLFMKHCLVLIMYRFPKILLVYL